MPIKCVVKNVIIFDLIFDTGQKKSKSNFSCSDCEQMVHFKNSFEVQL